MRVFFKKYRQHLPAIALITGFVWDTLTLGRPDQLYGNLVLLSYILIAGFTILFMARREYRGREQKLWIPLLLQFSFGNLAGGLLVLYLGSATIVGNWLFLLIILGMILGNEFFKAGHGQLRFNVTVYYFLVLLYSILLVPVLVRSIEIWTFFVSIAVSVGIIAGFLYILKLISKDIFERHRPRFVTNIAAVLVVFSMLYFTNVIPPVPLAVRDIAIVHSAEKVGEEYQLTYEEAPWYIFWRDESKTLRISESREIVACFSAVFAPASLNTRVFHVWEEYDAVSQRWIERGSFEFSIVGGREEGYRGYSRKLVETGEWRCAIKTERGALLGYSRVTVLPGTPDRLVTESR